MMALFGKVKERLNWGVATVGVKSRDVFNTTVLKSQIEALSKQKKNAVQELGDIVYALFLRGVSDEETVRNGCMAVVSLDGQRLEKEEKLRQIRLKSNDVPGGPISNAPCMSGNDIAEGTEFCTNCGNEMEVMEKCSAENKVCPTCGPSHPLMANLYGEDDTLLQGSPTFQQSELNQVQTENLGVVTGTIGETNVDEIDAKTPQGKEGNERTETGDKTVFLVCPTCGTEYSPMAKLCEKDRTLLG